MKKVFIAVTVIIITIAIVSFIAIVDPFGWKETPIIPTPPPVETPASEQITINTIPRENQSTNLHVDTKRPMFVNLPNSIRNDEINNEIINSINPYIDEILMVSENSTEMRSKDNVIDTKVFEYYVDYDRYNNDEFVSLLVNQDIRISIGGSASGGLRSNKWIDTYVINAKTSEKVKLGDICHNIPNYKAEIKDEITSQAKARNIPIGLLNISDDQKFYIKDRKLVIYFEPAAIAPFLDGELTFEMPFRLEDGQFYK